MILRRHPAPGGNAEGVRRASGIVGALITIPIAVLPIFGCVIGRSWRWGRSIVIQFIPKFERPLLSQAEIEAETRRMRGY